MAVYFVTNGGICWTRLRFLTYAEQKRSSITRSTSKNNKKNAELEAQDLASIEDEDADGQMIRCFSVCADFLSRGCP